MPLLVVRHAHAVSRVDWDADDADRPLSDRGRRQARGLADLLAGLGPKRLLSSPYVRCVDTLGPLADRTGLVVEPDDRLAEGEGRAAVGLARSLAGDDLVLCSHGDVIPEMLAALAVEDGVDLGSHPRVQKGSVWVLEGRDGGFESARYLPPPH